MARYNANKSVDILIRGCFCGMCTSGSQPDIAFVQQKLDKSPLAVDDKQMLIGVPPAVFKIML